MSTSAKFAPSQTSIHRSDHTQVNESSTERLLLAVGAGALAVYGLSRRSPGGLLLTVLGAGLLHQSVSGHCELYHAMGVNRSSRSQDETTPVAQDVHIEEAININKSPAEIYSFWRSFENLPRFMRHLESVTRLGSNRWHWVAKGPAGLRIEWDAEIYNEKENELIAWRALPGSEFENAGTVRFEPTGNGTGSIVRVIMNYNVPGGKLTAGLAHLLRQSPEQFLAEDLYRLKQLLETGEIVSGEDEFSGYVAGEPGSERHTRHAGGTLMGRAHTEVG